MELDDWDLSAEDLESLEKDALRQIAQRNSSSSCTSTSNYTSVSNPFHKNTKHPIDPQQKIQAQSQFTRFDFDVSPIKPRHAGPRTQVDPCTLQPRILPTSAEPPDESAKELPKLHVKFLLHMSGNMAAKFPFDQIETLDPLVRRAIATTAKAPDLQAV